MAKAIQFVVRDSAGGTARGSVAGDAGNNFIQLGSGDAISLNLSRQSVAGYARQGDDLVLTLIDGRTITLDGYFNTAGQPNQLYLSQNGEVIAVELSNSGDGGLYANYGVADSWDKYSNLDALRFGEGDDLALAGGAIDEPAGMAMFAPGLIGLGGIGAGLAGLGLAGAVIGGGGGGNGGNGGGDNGGGDNGGGDNGGGDNGGGDNGGGDNGGGDNGGGDNGGGRRPPTVDPAPPKTVIIETPDKDLDVTGTGEPGDKVIVTIGDKTQETIIEEDGTWEVTFPGTDLPADGTHTTVVDFEHTDGTTTELPGPEFILDLTPPDVDITEGSQSVGHVENAADYTDGVRIAGTGEPGATVDVTVDGTTHTTVISAEGTWSVVFTNTEVAGGERSTGITVVATDPLGNTTVITDTLVIDTIPNKIEFDSVTTDNVVSGGENGTGFVITGESVAGAVLNVTVSANGATYTQTVTAGAGGIWTLNIPAGTLPGGEYDATVTASSTDAAGNPNTQSHTFRVDTVAAVAFTGNVAGDNIVNASEATNVVLTGTSQPGTTRVMIEWQGSTLPATVSANGNWTVTFPAVSGTSILTATTATVTATDAYGNTATASRVISIDLGNSVAFDPIQAGDNVVSGVERGAGVTLTGTGEPGATVVVEFGTGSRTVTIGSGGTWSANFSTSEIPSGNGLVQTARVTSTDVAGNVATATHPVTIDTLVSPFNITGDSTNSIKADNVLNNAEAASGLTVTGTVEAGSQVSVTFGSHGPYSATVTGGTWTVTIPAGVIPPGETTVNLVAVATDRYGNTAELPPATIVIDRVVRYLTADEVISGDGYINAAERLAGVPFGGTAEPHSKVDVVLSNGHTLTTHSDAAGNWSVTIPAAYLPEGNNSTLTATVNATDLAGNTASLPARSVVVDTEAPDALSVVHIGQSTTNNMLTEIYTDGTSELVSIWRVDNAGAAVKLDPRFAADQDVHTGTEWVEADRYALGQGVPDGSYLVLKNLDQAGNESSTLFIVDNTNRVDVNLDRAGLEGFDFSTIDLTMAPQARLTITNQDLKDLTGGDNDLIIRGGNDDSVRLDSTSQSAGTRDIDGQTFHAYTMANGTVLIEDGITTTFTG